MRQRLNLIKKLLSQEFCKKIEGRTSLSEYTIDKKTERKRGSTLEAMSLKHSIEIGTKTQYF